MSHGPHSSHSTHNLGLVSPNVFLSRSPGDRRSVALPWTHHVPLTSGPGRLYDTQWAPLHLSFHLFPSPDWISPYEPFRSQIQLQFLRHAFPVPPAQSSSSFAWARGTIFLFSIAFFLICRICGARPCLFFAHFDLLST